MHRSYANNLGLEKALADRWADVANVTIFAHSATTSGSILGEFVEGASLADTESTRYPGPNFLCRGEFFLNLFRRPTKFRVLFQQ